MASIFQWIDWNLGVIFIKKYIPLIKKNWHIKFNEETWERLNEWLKENRTRQEWMYCKISYTLLQL